MLLNFKEQFIKRLDKKHIAGRLERGGCGPADNQTNQVHIANRRTNDSGLEGGEGLAVKFRQSWKYDKIFRIAQERNSI